MFNGNSGQDWKPVVFNSKSQVQKPPPQILFGASLKFEKSCDSDKPRLPYLNKQCRDMLIMSRCNAKLSQQDVANRLAVKVDLIKSLENGHKLAVESAGPLLNKIKRLFPGLKITYTYD